MFIKNFYRAAFISAIALIVCGKLHAQPKDIDKELYKASTIPDSLKENANAVVRYSADEYLVRGPGRASVKHYRLVTILNEKADGEAILEIPYDKKYNSISSVEIKAYNAAGVLLKKYGKSDMYDRSAVDNETTVTDYRYLALRHVIASYPITIETSYEKSYTSFIDLQDWVIQQPEIAIQSSVCKIAVNPALGFRFLNKNIKLQPTPPKQLKIVMMPINGR